MGSGPLGINFGYRDTDTHGMLEVTGIDPNSRMAAVRELRPGMLLAELEGRSAATSSPSQFAEIQRRISERSPDEKGAAFPPPLLPVRPCPDVAAGARRFVMGFLPEGAMDLSI